MSALTVILCVWATVAVFAVLFIRGATSRFTRPSDAEKAFDAKRTRQDKRDESSTTYRSLV